MNTRLHTLVAPLLLGTALASGTASAVTFESATTVGGTAVQNYSELGLLAFDIDFANFAPVTMEFRIDAEDLSMPIAFNSIIRNLTGAGIDSVSITLSQSSFNSIGSVTRFFGGTSSVVDNGGSAVVNLSPAEFFEVELGNALGTSPAATDWTLAQAGFQAGDRFTVTVAIPEPGTYALMLGGLGVVGWLARRRRVA